MEIILTQDLENVGLKNDIVKVKPGYARNYLIPKGYAIVANEGNKKNALEIVKQQKLKYEKMLEEIKAISSKLEDGAVKVGAKVGQNGKIFGSITTLQLANAISEQKEYTVDRKQVNITDEVKNLGTYKAKVNLHRDLDPVEITFEVVEE